MSVDIPTVKRVARLARIAVSDADAERMTGELNVILGFVEQLNEVDVTGVEPMTSVIPMDDEEASGRGDRRRQAGRHRRQRTGDRREFLPCAEGGGVAANGGRDFRGKPAAGRRARHGGGTQRLHDPADAARIPVSADGRADGRSDRHHADGARRERQPRGHGIAQGARRRTGRGEAHVHAAGGARQAHRCAAVAADREDWRATRAFRRLVLETGEAPGFEPAWRVYERGGFTVCGAVLDYPDSGFSRFYEKKIA